MENKLWLIGMFRGERKTLENSISHIIKYFDGLITVIDDRATVEDVEWLNSIKGEGKVILKKWVNQHDHTSNEIFYSGVMQDNDWFCFIDETDKLNEVFAKDLRESCSYWNKNGVAAVWLDHPFVLKYHSGLKFVGSPHWSISGIMGKVVDLSKINGYLKESYLFNTRNLLKSGFISPAKYWYSYPNLCNQTQLLYGSFGQQIQNYHEGVRIQFKSFCKYELGLDSSLNSLINYMVQNVGNYPRFFEEVLEMETNLKDMFRLNVLKEPLDNLLIKRFDWSYFLWKKTGDATQKDSEWVSNWNQYKKAAGLPTEV